MAALNPAAPSISAQTAGLLGGAREGRGWYTGRLTGCILSWLFTCPLDTSAPQKVHMGFRSLKPRELPHALVYLFLMVSEVGPPGSESHSYRPQSEHSCQ